MKTVWDPDCRHEIIARFEKLTPTTHAAWGRMTASQMLAHVADPMKTAMGEKAAAPKSGLFTNPVVRGLIIYCLPWPKGAPTAPEFVHGEDEEHFGENLSALRATVERFAVCGENGPLKPHPAFGRISGKAWGRLTYRHLDHHLRQFGV